jgi:NADPH:quinone reductase-like Zn-dependent oxidoreductase
MKRIQYYSYGGPETMKLEAFELKAPGTGEVAVKVKFAAINPIDWKVRNGYLKMVTGKKFPRAMGSDFSGIVTAVGAGVTRFKIGDPVFGMAQIKHGGALGEAVIAPQTFVARRPDSVSFEDAACLATPGVTAWNGLVDKAALRAIFNRKLKPIVCTARADILDGLAVASANGKLRLPVAETVRLNDAIPLIAALEAGHMLAGKALVAM